MNHYHIYGTIGRGKYSTVYKGRKKKTIEYFAVKSVDKSQRNKVLQEVRILHSLNHPNVLKFYSWYETTAHLWLVLEYCVGGDLMNLLRQDGHLPEDSVHDLACDLVKALQYIHSQGIIYCDLKPSNILLDENGRAKLCDFGLARRLSDISKTPTSALPQAKRGTPCYMAPELFEDGGVHSYASDFWALGCVLYECYAGRPPFVDKEFTRLVKSILSDPTPPLPGSPSRLFVNLINCLLIKDPAERMKWSELCGHAFWRNKFTDVPLPLQPAFSNMIELHARPCLSECNGERSLKNKTPPRHREKDAKGPSKQDENAKGHRGHDTPAKAVGSACKTQMRTPRKGAEEKPKTTRLVNLLRLSRIAKTNLQRENEKENYRRPLATDSENDSEVKIENTDMELDFNESAEDETQEEPDGFDTPSSTAADQLRNENNDQDNVEEMDTDMQVDAAEVLDEPVSDDSRAADQESCLDAAQVATSPPSVSPQLKDQKTNENSRPTPESASPNLSNNLSEIIWHPSDLSVRPVMPSRKSDKASEVIPSLPFEALQASDFVKMSKDQLEALTTRILAVLNGNTRPVEKQNALRYLEMLSSNPDAANVLTNGPIMLVLVKMLRLSKVAVLRVQLASLIGLLIRHSTFIDDELSNSEIIGSLKDGLRDGQEKVRRFSMAALGELLFYISTQNEQNYRENNPSESPLKDNRSASGWQVQNSLISLVSSTLRKGEDDMTQLYALRTIENICSQGGHWVGRFTSQDVITNLCYIYRAPGKSENMRLTAGSCLVRLVRFAPPTIQLVAEKLSLKDIASAIDSSSKRIASLDKGSARDQQIRLNLLIMAMLASHIYTNVNRHISQLTEVKNLGSSMVSLIEQGTEVLRGKALVFVALLCKSSRKWLLQFFSNTSLISAVDRLSKEKDDYLQQCINASVQVVASAVPGLLDSISGYIQHTLGGRRPAIASPINNRMVPKATLQFQLFAIVLNLLASPFFKHRVATHEVLQQLANIVKLAENPFQGRDDLQLTLLRIIESLTEELSWVLESSDIFVGILPSLAIIYKGNNNGNARFLCLKILFDVMITLLNEPTEQISEALKSISHTHFLPIYPILVEDEDPIPIYAQKLLLMLIEFNYIKVQDILHPKTVSRCFGFLLGDLSNANVNDVKLCLALASAPEIESKLLSQLKAVRRIGNLLEYAYVRDMEDFLEPILSLCRAFLLHSLRSQKNSTYSKEPSLLSETSSEASGSINQQEGVRDIVEFGSNAGVFLELSKLHDISVSDIASECIILLLKAAPREGTVGVLTNLSKVSAILDSFQKHVSHHLIVLRVLHALGYSCRQYTLHAMILSLSMSDILKIEGIVTEMKSSSTPDLANAAMLVCLELRRLPRCN